MPFWYVTRFFQEWRKKTGVDHILKWSPPKVKTETDICIFASKILGVLICVCILCVLIRIPNSFAFATPISFNQPSNFSRMKYLAQTLSQSFLVFPRC